MSNYFGHLNKMEADNLNSISIYWLRKNKYLVSGFRTDSIKFYFGKDKTGSINMSVYLDKDHGEYLQLDYLNTDIQTSKKTQINYKILITRTKCYFGGNRYWFTCPGVVNGKYCGRRVAKIYSGNRYFWCRHCHNLTYKSRNYSHKYRYGFYHLVSLICRSDEIQETIKKHHYRGKPTKKYKAVMKIAGGLGQLTI